MKQFIKKIIFIVGTSPLSTFALAGGLGGMGGSPLANCFQDSTFVFESMDSNKDFSINPWIIVPDEIGMDVTTEKGFKDLVGVVSPDTFAALKDVFAKSSEEIAVSTPQNNSFMNALKVNEFNYYANPDEIELVLENNAAIHLTPFVMPDLNSLGGLGSGGIPSFGGSNPSQTDLSISSGCASMPSFEVVDIASFFNK